MDRPGEPGRRRSCGGLGRRHRRAGVAVHAPCLLITQRVWSHRPVGAAQSGVEAAPRSSARAIVVVHPPFRWQREYARDSSTASRRMDEETDVAFAVENMYPVACRGARDRRVRTRLGPHRRGLSGTSRSTSRTPPSRARTPWRMADAPRRPARARPPGRRQRLGQGRAPGARPRHAAVRGAAGAAGPAAGSSGTVVLEVNTRRASYAPRSVRPTSPRGWRSPG